MFPKSLEIANLKLPEAWLETQFRAREPLNTFSPNFTTCIENAQIYTNTSWFPSFYLRLEPIH